MSPFILLFPLTAMGATAGLFVPSDQFYVSLGIGLGIIAACTFLSPYLARLGFLGCAVYWAAFSYQQTYHHQLEQLPKTEVTFYGEAADVQQREDGALKGFFTLHGYWEKETWHSLKGKFILVLSKGAASKTFPAKAPLLIKGQIKPFSKPQAPWHFDAQEFGLARSLLGTLRISHAKKVLVLHTAQPPFDFSFFRHDLRTRLRHYLTPREAGLILALLIGDTALFEPSQRDIYQNVGAGHLLAVSGLQVTLFAVVLFFIFLKIPLLWREKALPPKFYRAVIFFILIFIWLYVGLCAWPASACRAAFMSSQYLIGLAICRPQRMLDILCTCGTLSLFYCPAQVIDPSFTLSYAALFGLGLFAHLPQPHQPVRRLLCRWSYASLGSTLATLPLAAHYFKEVVPSGFLANIILVPIASFIQLPALLLACLGLVFEKAFLCHWGAACAGLIEAICECMGQYLPSPMACPSLSWPSIYLVSLILICLPWLIKNYRYILLGTLMLLLPLGVDLGLRQDALQIDVLPVGHGDATFLSFTNGQTMLIDGGGHAYGPTHRAPRVLLEYLQRRKITHIDVLVVSHPDPDHINGLIHIIDVISATEIWHSGFSNSHPLMARLLSKAKRNNINIKAQQHLPLHHAFGDTQVDLLAPRPTLKCLITPFEEFETNDNSLVMRFTHRDYRLLWPGDIEAFGEEALLHQDLDLKMDIVKAPHHGSDTSSSLAFVRHTRPTHVIFTVPQHSRFGFPKPDIVERWHKAGAHLWSTGTNGLIHIEIDDKIRVEAH